MSTTFVAPSTKIPVWSLPTPSICTKNSVKACFWPPLLFPLYDATHQAVQTSRDPPSESISSMKITVGLFFRASWNRFFTNLHVKTRTRFYRAVSPCHLLTGSADDTDMNVLSAWEATAFAK